MTGLSVIVVGAGIAGLKAACDLERSGAKVCSLPLYLAGYREQHISVVSAMQQMGKG